MLLILVTLLGCVFAADACLQCDRRVRVLHEELARSAPTLKEQDEITDIYKGAYERYKETSKERKGIIDFTSMYRAGTEYRNEFNLFRKRNPHSGSNKAIWIVEKGKDILKKHLDIFIRDGLCPNKCGLLRRRVMDCESCHYKTYICPSPSGQQDCGEHRVQAEEGGQAMFDCFLPWHQLLTRKPEYNFTWAPGEPGTAKLNETNFKVLVVTEESFWILNQLEVEEQGTYRCTVQDRSGTVFYRVTFLLTVVPSPITPPKPRLHLPTLPAGYEYGYDQQAEDIMVGLLVTITVLALVGSADFTSMYRAGTEYLYEFRLFMQTHHSGPFEATQIMRKSKTILKKHLELFICDGLCPNKCETE
ncbi:izumo sperm-egg fusion protein 1-like [Limanda limanda]|uniref:izumo sperm-egg fusion protein 1-like n=1 Tax=Limanda limanda TaxID=27771 RepID=UPI0029C9A2F4|nr:izumo sperm-egg fusion protein 1-like [Limanda limanda]